MGMDIQGMNPENSDGEYFSANVWSWRPIHALCHYAIEKYALPYSTEGWGYNDGRGLSTQEECTELANRLEEYVEHETTLEDDSDRIYLALGMWCKSNGSFLSSEEETELNTTYPEGSVMYSRFIAKDGTLVEPTHSVTLKHVKLFIKFLRNCGGFEIY